MHEEYKVGAEPVDLKPLTYEFAQYANSHEIMAQPVEQSFLYAYKPRKM
jgi:hypothetical protein